MPTPLATDTQNANLESRSQIIRDIYPKGTPFLSLLKSVAAKGRTHLFQYQSLPTPAIQTGIVEGATVTHAAGDMIARSELTNHCQNFRQPFEATFDQDAVAKPGDIGSGKMSEYNKAKALASIALVRNLDITLFANATPVQPVQASSTSGVLGGVQYWLNTGVTAAADNVIDATASGQDGMLTQDMYDDGTRAAYRDGGLPAKAFMGTFQKRRVAKFVQNVTRNISEAGKKLVDVINTYENIIGVQDIITEPQLDIVLPGFVFQIDMQHIGVAYLRTLTHTMEGNAGSRNSGFVDLTVTLEFNAPQTASMITNLRTR